MPLKDPAERKEYNRDYRRKNKVRLHPLDAAYRKKHRKRIIKYLRAWKKENPDYDKQWRENNRDKKNKNQRKYVHTHLGKIKADSAKYLTRKTKAGGSFTAKQWLSLCKKYDYRCLCCNKHRKLTADHVIPVSKGGTSNIDNIQPLCQPCNSSKNAKSADYRKRKTCRKRSQKISGLAKP